MVLQAQIPPFGKTQTPLSPIDLYKNFKATDAKALVSIQALTVLNIHYGGKRTVSKNALTEFLHNLTFEALSKENDEIYLSFDYIGDLVLDILEGLAKKDQQSVEVAKTLNENIKQELDKTKFQLELPPELQVQEDLKKYFKKEKKPTHISTALHFTSAAVNSKKKKINKTYDDIKEDYLKTAMAINKTDLDAAIDDAVNADEKNEKTISNLINPTSGLFVDDQLNLEDQFKLESSNIERSFALTNQIQQRLDNVLEMMIKNN